MDKQTEVFFIVDGQRLEAQACLLAPTLKANLTSNQKAAAYVREDYFDQVDTLTFEVLEAADVAVRKIPATDGNERIWTAPYPQGNKILAAAQPRSCDLSVFLDTDTILVTPVDFAYELGNAEIGACISDYTSPSNTEEGWTAFYGCFDLPLPTERVRLQAGRKLLSLPYYNAGMIIFRERLNQEPTEIGPQWLRLAQKFDRDVVYPYDRANIDQFTLPILGYDRAKPVEAMDQRLNSNIRSHGFGEGQTQSIVHYHNIGALWAHPDHALYTLNCLSELCGEGIVQRMLERFGPHVRRQRLKRLISL